MIFELSYNNLDEKWHVVEAGRYDGTSFGVGNTAQEAYDHAKSWTIDDSDHFDCWNCDFCNICGECPDA